MKNPGTVSLAMLLAILSSTTCAIGQTWSIPVYRSGVSNCPVGLEASRGGVFAKREVSRESRPGDSSPQQAQVPNQQIQLTLTNPSSRAIVAAELTAHGFSDHWRTVPLSSGVNNPDLAQQLKITFSVKANGHATQDLALSRFTAITSIDVSALTYADGSTWRAVSSGDCSVTPSALVLVSSR
jgi:hypothetical protein